LPRVLLGDGAGRAPLSKEDKVREVATTDVKVAAIEEMESIHDGLARERRSESRPGACKC
jgi:hypothetical protein